jgi:hypothetical protein
MIRVDSIAICIDGSLRHGLLHPLLRLARS